tara:strand:+ start:57 stop:674 length:618 start_codon:yes stop_codon:yes gene_type:complete
MDYENFINTTLNNTHFKIISSNNNGSCCYDSILKLLKKYKLIKPNINTKTLQAQAVNWVIKYKSYYLYEYDLTLEQLVLFTHHFNTFDEYIKNYKVYCADKKKINSNINWGGTPELIALSNIYNVNINVYIAWSYSKKYDKIIKGTIISNKPRSDCRFKNLLSTRHSIFNNNNNNNNNDKPTNINILYTKYKNNSSHFDMLVENI